MSLCDVASPEVRHENKNIPLVGCCGEQECIDKALLKLDLKSPVWPGPAVEVVGGKHKGLVGTLYSTNQLGVSFIRPEPPDGTLKAVKTSDVVRR
jgi:hypothetical protein